MRRAAQIAYWAAPSLFCLAVYWLGLKVWFQQDDFAWLTLNDQLAHPSDLWPLLFSPQAQGTVRVLSERLYFIVLDSVFGLNALPFRLVAFATQFANLILVALIAKRLTGSRLAGFLAPVLWTATNTLAGALCWNSAYNQILYTFFLLAAFYCRLIWLETGRRRWAALEWAAFLLGFGTLEIIVVYPVIAIAYTVIEARNRVRPALWLLAPSICYGLTHWFFIPKPTSGPYHMYWDASILKTLWTYWEWMLGFSRAYLAGIRLPQWGPIAGTLAMTAALAGFALYHAHKRNLKPLLLLFWFLVLLAPVAPLRDHKSDYYLTAPVVGPAILAAWGLASARSSRLVIRFVAFLLVASFLAVSMPTTRIIVRWHYDTSRRAKNLVLGLLRASQLHPGKAILLAEVPSELFWVTLYNKPNLVVGVRDVYLTPEAAAAIEPHPELAEVRDYMLPAALARTALESDRAVVYAFDPAEEKLRNVTGRYRRLAAELWVEPELPDKIEAGSQVFASQLGPGWYQVEGLYRWMARQAEVTLRGPQAPGAKIILEGYCPRQQVKEGPLEVVVRAGGILAGRGWLHSPDAAFKLEFPVPEALVGQPKATVSIEVSRTFRAAGDNRELGLVFGKISIR